MLTPTPRKQLSHARMIPVITRDVWEVFCGTDSACNLTYDHTLRRLYSDVGKEDMIHLSLFPIDRDTAFRPRPHTVLLRIQLSSTVQRRKRSPKTEPFENALQSWAIWKRCFLKRYFLVWTEKTMLSEKRLRHQNRRDRAPDNSTVGIQKGRQTLSCALRV